MNQSLLVSTSPILLVGVLSPVVYAKLTVFNKKTDGSNRTYPFV